MRKCQSDVVLLSPPPCRHTQQPHAAFHSIFGQNLGHLVRAKIDAEIFVHLSLTALDISFCWLFFLVPSDWKRILAGPGRISLAILRRRRTRSESQRGDCCQASFGEAGMLSSMHVPPLASSGRRDALPSSKAETFIAFRS